MADGGKGFITVNVRTASGAIPIEGAMITVKTEIGVESDVVAVMFSDSGGASEVITLPAPLKNNSLQPGNEDVCSLYTVDTDRDGYYTVINSSVPIYDGITAIQQVNLVPKAGGKDLYPSEITRFREGQLPNL